MSNLPQIKTCSDYCETKPVSEFYKKTDRDRGWSSYCKECHKIRSTRRIRANRSDHAKAMQKWQRQNRARLAAYNSCRRKKTTYAMPSWLTNKHKKQINLIYAHAQDVRMITGEAYHVDHIVPLTSDVVCGLHVPWNLQILPADLNISKSNQFDCWWID